MPRTARLASLLAFGLAALGCSKPAAPSAAPPPTPVVVAPVEQRDVDVAQELVGQLRGFQDVEVRARVEGFLASIDYVEGGEVKKGDLLFTIDPRTLNAAAQAARADLARAQTALDKAQLDVRRYTPLAAQRAVSQAELDQAQSAERSARAQLDASQAALDKAQLDLSYTRVTAPVAGLSSKAEKQVGSLVGRGESTLLTTVSSVDPIRVSVQLPEAEYLRFAAKIAAGERAPAKIGGAAPAEAAGGAGPQLILADGTVHPARGRVVLVDRAVDPTTGTIRVDLAFANPSRTLRPGLYGKVRFNAERLPGALLIPQRAVSELQGTYSAAVVTPENKVELRKLQMGPRSGDAWVVLEGLKAGERVVVEGVQKVRNGSPVAPQAAGAAGGK